MRKILILARESGAKIELSEIEKVGIVPDAAFEVEGWDALFASLQGYDKEIETRRLAAEKEGKKMRYLARYVDGKASVGLHEVDDSHPAYHLGGTDNIVLLTTKRYNLPLVVRGAGAGPAVTASGVFADIMRVVNG